MRDQTTSIPSADAPVKKSKVQRKTKRGLSSLFDGWKTVPKTDGTFLLEKK